MATEPSFVEYVCEQAVGPWEIRSRKMFGEYMMYANDKAVFLICDNTVFVKQWPELEALLGAAERGYPYEGAREHYILDIDNADLVAEVLEILERVTPLPKKRKPKAK